jgi:HlyD family secretion protein
MPLNLPVQLLAINSPARAGRCILHLVAIAALTILGITAAPAQQRPANVVVAEVIRVDVAARQSFVGNVTAYRRVVVGSAVDGRVLEFPVQAGQQVTAQQPLAQLRTATIEIEIEGAKAELQLRTAELEELRNGSRPEELQLARASVQAATAMQDFALARFTRAERLARSGSAISQDEFEETRAQSLQAAATLAEATSQLELVQQGPRLERIKQAEARAAVQQQVIAGLEDRLEKYTVRAPFDGFVVTELTQSGAWLQQGMAVAEIVDIDPIEVEVYVPESNIGFVRRGLRCAVRVEAFPERTFEGEVVQIVPLADSRARTFPVKVRIANPAESGQHALLPGMLAQVRLPTSNLQQELMVPKDALQLGGAQPVVLKVVDAKAIAVPVNAGVSLESMIAVTPAGDVPLAEGDLIVVRGNERLRSGQAVNIASRLAVQPPATNGAN